MSSERDFVQSLSNFLALHTQQSPGYFNHLIESFIRGANPPSDLEPSAKDEIKRRLKTEMEAQDNVPSFLQYYLLRRLTQNDWTPQATFIASDMYAAGRAKGSSRGSAGYSSWLSSMGSRSAARSLAIASCFIVKEQGVRSVGVASPVSRPFTISPFTQCSSMNCIRAPSSNWDLVQEALHCFSRICAHRRA